MGYGLAQDVDRFAQIELEALVHGRLPSSASHGCGLLPGRAAVRAESAPGASGSPGKMGQTDICQDFPPDKQTDSFRHLGGRDNLRNLMRFSYYVNVNVNQ